MNKKLITLPLVLGIVLINSSFACETLQVEKVVYPRDKKVSTFSVGSGCKDVTIKATSGSLISCEFDMTIADSSGDEERVWTTSSNENGDHCTLGWVGDIENPGYGISGNIDFKVFNPSYSSPANVSIRVLACECE